MAFITRTYSLDAVTLERFDKILEWTGEINKSQMIADLISREYFRLLEQKEQE